MITYYSGINELILGILTTISRMKETYKFDGWIRGDKVAIQSYLANCDFDEIIELTGSTIVKQLETTEKDQ